MPVPIQYLQGTVDQFIGRRMISGWVKPLGPGHAAHVTVTVHRDGRLIGQGGLTLSRPDIDPGEPAGFRISCTEDIPDEQFAFGLLRIEAGDDEGRSVALSIWDKARSVALARLLKSTPFGAASAAVMLESIGRNKRIDEKSREAVRELYDLHFEKTGFDLAFRFENLGGDASLSFVQRAYGAEPLGLLRFAAIGIDPLIAALQNRFEGVGSPEFTRLTGENANEYRSSDTRYYMLSPISAPAADADFETLYQQQCQRISFLARDLLDKLREGEKIFVIHALPAPIPEEKLGELLTSFRALSSAPLLYLQAATAEHPAGSVTMREDGIMTGYVKPLAGDWANAEIREGWLKVWKNADAMVRAATVERAA